MIPSNLNNTVSNLQKSLHESGRVFTWYNLTEREIKLPDGTILKPKRHAESKAVMVQGVTISGVPSCSIENYELTLDELPFPAYDVSIRYMVDANVVVNHPERKDIFHAYTDSDGTVVKFLTTSDSNKVLVKQTYRTEKASRNS